MHLRRRSTHASRRARKQTAYAHRYTPGSRKPLFPRNTLHNGVPGPHTSVSRCEAARSYGRGSASRYGLGWRLCKDQVTDGRARALSRAATAVDAAPAGPRTSPREAASCTLLAFIAARSRALRHCVSAHCALTQLREQRTIHGAVRRPAYPAVVATTTTLQGRRANGRAYRAATA